MAFILGLLAEWFIFWPLLIGCILLGGHSAEQESYGWSAIFSVAILALAWFAAPSIMSVLSHPVILASIVGGYIVVGVCWSTGKWYLHLKKFLNKFLAVRDEYIRQNKLGTGFFTQKVHAETPVEHRKHHENFAGVIRSEMYAMVPRDVRAHVSHAQTAHDSLDAIQPKIWDNKARVIAWGAYWPTSMLWFFLNDFVREVVNAIYNAVSGRFQAMSDRLFKNAL